MKKILLSLIGLICILSRTNAQDKIYRNNGKIVEAKVLEIASDEIRYKEFRNPDGPIYILETDKIKKIVFENGTSQKFQENFKDPERYEGQLNKALKLNFLSPLYGYTEFDFEKSTGVGKGYELSFGVIGLGKSETLQYNYYSTQFSDVKRGQAGAFVSGGYKFNKLPDFIIFGKTRMTHLMQGTYAKPILYFGYYKENQIIDKGNNVQEIGKQHVTFGALQIEIGHQWVFGDKFLLDLYEGLGYAVDNKKDAFSSVGFSDPFDNSAAFNYANARLGKSPGFSYTFGIKFGMLIK
ncbi:MAG TPA: hypothetical protein VK588_05780 [Chitinophagaceae bacterium]|nr:hypothetical protein [Chitinophagaceae bacterium]